MINFLKRSACFSTHVIILPWIISYVVVVKYLFSLDMVQSPVNCLINYYDSNKFIPEINKQTELG